MQDSSDNVKERKREYANIEERVDTSIRKLEDSMKKGKERLITATRNNIMICRTTTRKQKCEEKQLYGHFKRRTDEILHKKIVHGYRKETLRDKLNLF